MAFAYTVPFAWNALPTPLSPFLFLFLGWSLFLKPSLTSCPAHLLDPYLSSHLTLVLWPKGGGYLPSPPKRLAGVAHVLNERTNE